VVSIVSRLKRVASDFAEMRIDDARLPYAERRAITLLIAARPWEPEFFSKYKKQRAKSVTARR
jgi:hypothetical protein